MTSHAQPRGFTLIELVVAMVIIGILTAIAIPSYTAYVQRSARGEARGQLLEASIWLERVRTETGRYDIAAAPGTQALPLPLRCAPRNTTGVGCRDYNVGIAAVNAVSYQLQAVPVAGSRMAGDECGNLQLDNAGLRARTGTGQFDLCWTR
jgi:type IV pilus assembly protein PilE